jgi:hypothetical protein
MGAVFLAEHESLATKKVVTLLLAEYSRNEIIRQRFEREATAASRFAAGDLKLVQNYPNPKALEQLPGTLHAKAFGTADGDDGRYDFTNLELALRRRKPWLASPR